MARMFGGKITRYVIGKIRIERLRREIFYLESLPADTKLIRKNLQSEIDKLQEAYEHAYGIVSKMKNEQMRLITEMRFFDGKDWETISLKTGLSLPRLYIINREIRWHFIEHGRIDLLLEDD